MSIIEKLLCKLFPHTDIMRQGTDDIYLRRWFVYPRSSDFAKQKGVKRFYIHKFYRGDEDNHLHDHPWAFTSLILTRGYWEETPFDPDKPLPKGKWRGYISEDGEQRIRTFYPRFSLLRRPAVTKHRVILRDTKPVWTFLRIGLKERSWGFWIKNKLCPWRRYDNGVCWCGDDKEVPEA